MKVWISLAREVPPEVAKEAQEKSSGFKHIIQVLQKHVRAIEKQIHVFGNIAHTLDQNPDLGIDRARAVADAGRKFVDDIEGAIGRLETAEG